MNFQLPQNKKIEITDLLEFPDERDNRIEVPEEVKQEGINTLLKFGEMMKLKESCQD